MQNFVEHWGEYLQFYPNFALFSTLGGMNLDQDFFQASKFSEDQKKVFTRNGTRFSPNSITDLRSDAHQSQINGGDADEDHTQIVGGVYSQIIGGIYSPIIPGFGTTGPPNCLFPCGSFKTVAFVFFGTNRKLTKK